MCTEKITNPAQCFDAFDTEEEACEAIEDEHHMLFDCSGYASAIIQFQDQHFGIYNKLYILYSK